MQHRNDALRAIKGLGGDHAAKSLWKKLCGYYRRSLAETCTYRFKQIFGGSFRSRLLACQRTELHVKCLAMNWDADWLLAGSLKYQAINPFALKIDNKCIYATRST